MKPAPALDSWVTRIIVIDDDAVSALCLEALLRQEGFIPFKAHNGPDGRAMVRTQAPDLILLDVQMPGENGLETCRKLKADPATAEVPVIFLTGSEDITTKLDGFEAGAVDYITKPYQTAEVLARIRVHIRARRMMQLLASAQIAQLDRLAQAQKAILLNPEAMPQAKFAPFYLPIHAAGGDFYEVMQAGEQLFDYVVADVSGHDADASLVTSALKVLLHQGRSTLSSPLDTLRMVNTALGSAFPEHVYLTLAWARLNRNRKTLTTILAGHPPVLHLRPKAERPDFIEAPGDVLGSFPTIELEVMHRPVASGDRILMFTDGIIEMASGDDEPCRSKGMERLWRAASARRALPLDAMVHGVADELVQNARAVSDDLLLLGVEV